MNHPDRLTRLYAQGANVTVNGANPGFATTETFLGYSDRMREDYQKMSKTPERSE